jgi:hypothetical protein
MALYETFSKRQKKLRNQGAADPYQYDTFPKPLRVQISTLLVNGLGSYGTDYRPGDGASRWDHIHDTLAHEYGVFELAKGQNNQERCLRFLLQTDNVEMSLDFVELGFRIVHALQQSYLKQGRVWEDERKQCERILRELNYRLREHNLGYQFEEGNLIRIDSQYIHAEVVKPALALLHEIGFSGPSSEFLQAHEHYRAQRYPEAIAGALKAFESAMKGICDLRKWKYPPNVTAKGLIDIILSKQLIPSSLASQFTGLRSVLESGLPTLRNQQGGHGQGKDPVRIPSYMAAFALHLAASNIVMLVEAHRSTQK